MPQLARPAAVRLAPALRVVGLGVVMLLAKLFPLI